MDHYFECTKNYKLCDFGCGTFISNDDVVHFNHCSDYDNWIKTKPFDPNIDSKYLCHLKHNQLRFHNLKTELNRLKNNTLISSYLGTIIANENTISHILADLVLPDEDATWLVSVYLSWNSSVPGLDDYKKNIQQQINNNIPLLNQEQIRNKSIYDTYVKYGLYYNRFKSAWSTELKIYAESKSIKFVLSKCDNNFKQLFQTDWHNDVKKYVERNMWKEKVLNLFVINSIFNRYMNISIIGVDQYVTFVLCVLILR